MGAAGRAIPAWVGGRRPAPRTGATRRGPRPPGSIVRGSRPGPPGRHLPEAKRGPIWVSRARKSEREPGTPKASGWFDNRTPKIALNGQTVQTQSGERGCDLPDRVESPWLLAPPAAVNRQPPVCV